MWVSLLFLVVWFNKLLVHTAPLSVLNTDTQPNSADVLCRLTKLLFPQTGTSSYAQLQPDFMNDEILGKQQNEGRVNGAVINAVFHMPRVMAKLEERILRFIAGNDTSESESLTKPQVSNEAEIYAKLLQNISSEFVRKEEFLVKVQEQETRMKVIREEATQTMSQSFKDNIDKAVLGLEQKINAIDSSEAETHAKLLQNISGEFFRKEEYLAEVEEQETRIKMARDEATHITSQAFKDNLGKAVLALEEKINAVESKEKPVTKIDIPDTRSKDLTPQEYRSKGIGVYHEFKENDAIDLPIHLGYPQIAGRSYVVLKTIVPWYDPTGGYVMQIAYTGNAIRMRMEDISNIHQWSVWQNTSELS